MGQRHQIYIRLPQIHYSEGNPNNRKPKTIGFHHQWLYGATALEVLDNFLTVYARHLDDPYACLGTKGNQDEAARFIRHVLSVLPGTGRFERVSDISDTQAVQNPHYGDNNDGITIIDLETIGEPRYAFGSLGSTEGQQESLPEGLYSAREYLASYYPENAWAEVGGRGGMPIPALLERLDPVPLIDQDRARAIFPHWDSGCARGRYLRPDVTLMR